MTSPKRRLWLRIRSQDPRPFDQVIASARREAQRAAFRRLCVLVSRAAVDRQGRMA